MRRALFAVFATLALSACDTGKRDEAGGVAEIEAADAALNRAISAKDASAIAAFYADEAVMMPTAEPMIRGREAIAKEWAHIVAIPGFANSNRLIGSDRSGELAYTWGSYEAAMELEDGSAGVEPGKWLTVWRRQPDGHWRIVADTYNTDIPPPDHK